MWEKNKYSKYPARKNITLFCITPAEFLFKKILAVDDFDRFSNAGYFFYLFVHSTSFIFSEKTMLIRIAIKRCNVL